MLLTSTTRSVAIIIACLASLSIADPDDICAAFTLVKRSRWGALPARSVDYQTLPVPYAIVHHTVTATCAEKSACASIAVAVQAFHMTGYDDIGYK